MRALLLRLLLNMAALYVAVLLVPGLHFEGDLLRLAGVAVVFGLVNALLRPILTLLTCPFIVLTFGLFTLVINALLLLLTGWLSTRWGLGFRVDGFWAAFWGGLIVGIVSVVLSLVVKEGRREEVL